MTYDVDNTPIPRVTAQLNEELNEISFLPGSDFDLLATGETATVIISYKTQSEGIVAPGTLILTITGENDAPVGVDDDGVSYSSPVVIDVVGNDTDIDRSNQLSIKPNSPSIRSARLDADGRPVPLLSATVTHDEKRITFNPGSDFAELPFGQTATVIVLYTVTDDDNFGPLTDTATLTIHVFGMRMLDPVPAVAAFSSEFYSVPGPPLEQPNDPPALTASAAHRRNLRQVMLGAEQSDAAIEAMRSERLDGKLWADATETVDDVVSLHDDVIEELLREWLFD
jgi:hypothetical protein